MTTLTEHEQAALEQVLVRLHYRDVTLRLRRLVMRRLFWQECERVVFALVVGAIFGTLFAIGAMR